MGVSRKQSTSNFPKNEHSLPPDKHTYDVFNLSILPQNRPDSDGRCPSLNPLFVSLKLQVAFQRCLYNF